MVITLQLASRSGDIAFKVFQKEANPDNISEMTIADYDALELPGAGAPSLPGGLDETWNWKVSYKGWKFDTVDGKLIAGSITDAWSVAHPTKGEILFTDSVNDQFVLDDQFTITGTIPNITVNGGAQFGIESDKGVKKTFTLVSGSLEDF